MCLGTVGRILGDCPDDWRGASPFRGGPRKMKGQCVLHSPFSDEVFTKELYAMTSDGPSPEPVLDVVT